MMNPLTLIWVGAYRGLTVKGFGETGIYWAAGLSSKLLLCDRAEHKSTGPGSVAKCELLKAKNRNAVHHVRPTEPMWAST